MSDSCPSPSIPEDSMIWNFVASRIRSADGRLSIFRTGTSTWHEFKQINSSATNTAQYYANRFEFDLVPNLDSAPFSDHQKLDLFYALGRKITKEFRKKVEFSHNVKCDSDWYVVSYTNMGDHEPWDNVHWQYPQQVLEQLPEKRIRKPTYKIRQDSEEQIEEFCHKRIKKMWAFLGKQIRDPNTQELRQTIVSPDTWQKFLGDGKNEKEAKALHQYYLQEMAPNLHLMKFRHETALNYYWALGIVVNKEHLKNLLKHYDLTMDRKGIIEVYSKKPVEIKAEQFEPSKHAIQRCESPIPLKKVKIEPELSTGRVKSEVGDSSGPKNPSSCDSRDNNPSFSPSEGCIDEDYEFLNPPVTPSRGIEPLHDLKPSEASKNPIDEMADIDTFEKHQSLNNPRSHKRDASKNLDMIDDHDIHTAAEITDDDDSSEVSRNLLNSESFMDFMDEMDDDHHHHHQTHQKLRSHLKKQESFNETIDFNDTLQESQEPENADNEKKVRGRMLKSISNEMWAFLRNEIRDLDTGNPKKLKLTVETWRKFAKAYNVKKALDSLGKHFYTNVAPRLHECPFNTTSKMELYWSLELKINHRFFESLDPLYSFQISPLDTLLSYKLKTPKEHEDWWPKSSRIWAFVLEHNRNSCGQLVTGEMDLKSEEFRGMFNKQFRMQKSVMEIRKHINKILIPHMQDEEIPLADKLAVYYSLQIPIENRFLNHCRKSAQICVIPATGTIERFEMDLEETDIEKRYENYEDSMDMDDVQHQEDVPSTSGCQVLTWQNLEVLEMMGRGSSNRFKRSGTFKNPRGIPAEEFLDAVNRMTRNNKRFDKHRNVVEDDEYERLGTGVVQGKSVPFERVHQFFSESLNLIKSRIAN